GLAAGQRGFLEVSAAGTGQPRPGRGLADVGRRLRFLHLPLAGPAAAAEAVRAGLALRPAPRADVDRALVLVVARLAFNAVDLQEVVHGRHVGSLSDGVSAGAGTVALTPAPRAPPPPPR